jgi:predicted acylesterase/phospholipase RssA
MNVKKNINIYLSGGGVKGAYQGGFLNYLNNNLDHNKYIINKIYGTSIGSVNGALLLSNTIMDFWKKITNHETMIAYWFKTFNLFGLKIISMVYGFFFKLGIINPINFHNLIDKYCVVNKKYEKLAVTVTNITHSSNDYIFFPDIDFIKASTALWLLTPPINIGDNLYCDGGIKDAIPIKYLIEDEINKNDDIHLILIATKTNFYKKKSRIGFNVLFYLDTLIHTSSNIKIINDIKFINRLKKTYPNKVYYYIINQDLTKNIQITKFNENDIEKLLINGENDCKIFLEDVKY